MIIKYIMTDRFIMYYIDRIVDIDRIESCMEFSFLVGGEYSFPRHCIDNCL